MSIADFFTSGAAKLVDSVGSIINNVHTSDDEKLKAKLAAQSLVNEFQKEQNAALARYDKEISDRHKTDMNSDSWLSKNIRPLIVGFLTVSAVLLAYLTIFILEANEVKLLTPWIDMLKVLLVTAYSFYFGSRGIEKVQKLRTGAK